MATKTGSPLAPAQDQILKLGAFNIRIAPTGMLFPKQDLTFDEWRLIAGHFHAARIGQESIQWALADWLAYGGDKFCERDSETGQFKLTPMFSRYRQVAEATGYAHDHLKYMASIGRSVPREIRRNPQVLSFSHHAVVAALSDPKQQRELLDKAVRENLSVSDLRVEMRRINAKEAENEPNLPGLGGPHILSWTTSIERAISRMVEVKPIHEWPAQQRNAIKHDLTAHVTKMQSIIEKL